MFPGPLWVIGRRAKQGLGLGRLESILATWVGKAMVTRYVGTGSRPQHPLFGNGNPAWCVAVLGHRGVRMNSSL